MDDPWGSPWAEPTSKSTAAAPEPRTSLLSPPPRAFFGANTPGASPWADDSAASGGWADPNTSKQDDSPASAEWGAWGEASPTRLAPTTRLEHPGKASPLAWPSSAVPSPRLSPLPRSRASSTRRPSATDPWAAELSHSLARVDSHVPFVLERQQALPAPKDYHTPPESKSASQDGTRFETHHGVQTTGGFSLGEIPPAEDQEPRTSSSSIQTSPFDDTLDINRLHSRAIPTDEDLGEQVDLGTKAASGKVQELVGIGDSLNVEPEPAGPCHEKHSQSHQTLTGDENVSGKRSIPEHDAENGVKEDSESSSAGSEHPSTAAQDKLGESDASPSGQSEDNVTSDESADSQQYEGHSPAINEIITKYGPLTFKPNIEALDQAYAKITLPTVAVAEGLQPQDVIIKDSFGEISERKTWYRISRFGSMRKHDLGDDDSYTRVTWPSTSLHNDTIVIVRRWMEEDSFVGKSILGGNKRASVFNWDSQAAPVDLSTVYARKSSSDSSRPSPASTARHEAQSSVSSQTSTWGAKRHSRGPSQSDQSSSATPPIAPPAFGWSSMGSRATVSFAPPPAAPPALSTLSKKPAPSDMAKLAPRIEPLVLSKPGQSVPSQIEEDEDDDWGDMVGSPGLEDNTPSQMDSAFVPLTASQASAKPKTDSFSSMTTSASATWGKDDFSFFENKFNGGGSSIVDASNSNGHISLPTTTLSSTTTAPAIKRMTPASSLTINPSPTQQRDPVLSTKSRPQALSQSQPGGEEETRIIKSIVDALPDLSYMLR